MPPEPLLFDLDGTLIDSLPDIRASANHLRARYGLPEVSDEVASTYVGDGVFVLMERCLAEVGPFEPIREEAARIYFEHHREQCVKLVKPFAGVMEHLDRWRAEGRPLGIVTNKSEAFVLRILDHLEMRDYFPAVVCGDTLDVKKPAPEPVLEALRRLGVATPSGTMVGDSPQDVRAGRAAGIRTAAVLFGFSPESVLRAESADEYWPRFGVAE